MSDVEIDLVNNEVKEVETKRYKNRTLVKHPTKGIWGYYKVYSGNNRFVPVGNSTRDKGRPRKYSDKKYGQIIANLKYKRQHLMDSIAELLIKVNECDAEIATVEEKALIPE